MAIFKCKMCGGDLNIEKGVTVCECDYCGTKQTLPRLDDERKVNLYDRANHFRRNNEFDKAMGIYEQILNEDNTDAESYWSLVLCRYGIEYVEDPTTKRRVPTVNRAQFTSVFDDDNYKSALQYADALQKSVYEDEAKTINEIQKGILAISQNEEPFDVFICYKETDNNGRRTPDSVLATELYHELTREGFKVFFARITLEDKLGSAYEPYIFAALNSAKVMVVLGTKPEHFNAVWVKNEWSRYLSLIKNGAKKMLIPAYKDMDPYDLPEEFSHLQAQDMSKLGFMQDLVRGITKIVGVEEPKTTIVQEVNNTVQTAAVGPLLERAEIFLEDGDFVSADEYTEKVLDLEPKNVKAYIIKLMVDLKAKQEKVLFDCGFDYSENQNYLKALRFSNEEEKDVISKRCEANLKACEQRALKAKYDEAISKMKSAEETEDYYEAASLFETLSDYEDSEENYAKCLELADAAEKKLAYDSAKKFFALDTVWDIKKAKNIFEDLEDYGDSKEWLKNCDKRIAEIKDRDEKQNRKQDLIGWIFVGLVVLALVAIGVSGIIQGESNNKKYNNAVELMKEGRYSEAYDIFSVIGIKDSEEKAELAKFADDISKLNVGDTIRLGKDKTLVRNSYAVYNELVWTITEKVSNTKFVLTCNQIVVCNSSYSKTEYLEVIQRDLAYDMACDNLIVSIDGIDDSRENISYYGFADCTRPVIVIDLSKAME